LKNFEKVGKKIIGKLMNYRKKVAEHCFVAKKHVFFKSFFEFSILDISNLSIFQKLKKLLKKTLLSAQD